jgi:hypothetical protein
MVQLTLQCVLQNAGKYSSLDGCSLSNPNSWTLTSHDNRIYAPGAQVTVDCGITMTLAAFQKASGLEMGSTVSDSPSIAQMMAWGRQVLVWPGL